MKKYRRDLNKTTIMFMKNWHIFQRELLELGTCTTYNKRNNQDSSSSEGRTY